MSAWQASLIRSPGSPSMVISAASVGVDARAAATSAPSCIRSRPSTWESCGTAGRRTYSAGERSRYPSITANR